MSNTPNAGIPYAPEGALDPAAGLNQSLNVIDALIQTSVISMSSSAPPGSPSDGDRYIVASSPTGDWVGLEGYLVQYVAEGNFWQAYVPGEQVILVLNNEDSTLYFYNTSSSPGEWVPVATPSTPPLQSIMLVCSDETTALTTGNGKLTFRMPLFFTLSWVRASVTTAPTGATLTVDINKNGASILSTKITIDAGEKTSATAAVQPDISDTSLDDDAEITIDIDQIGSIVAGAGLKVYLVGVA